jgi:protoporphyrinogen oxidase
MPAVEQPTPVSAADDAGRVAGEGRGGTRSIAVIGGGISGLASAHRLARLGHRVTLIESETYLGGLGTTFPYREGNLERFYHCILPNDDALIRLIEDVGMGDELLWRATGMGFMYRGQVFPLNGPLDLLRFSPLSLLDRIRLGTLAIRARIGGLNPRLDHIGVADWIRGIVGERAFEILWRPLLEAKIGDAYPAIPALWLSSRMHREKSTNKEVKGCLRDGYASLIDAIEGDLRRMGVEIRLGVRVAGIERVDESMALRYEHGSTERFDTVVATSPLVAFRKMTQGLELPDSLRDLELDYQGVISGVFLLEKPLSPYYWMPIVDSGATAQGVIEMSNLVPLERSDGRYVTYLVNYTHRSSELFAKSDDELLALYRHDLETLFPDAGRTVLDAFLFRAPFVEPLWTLGYGARRPDPSVIPGRLYLAGTSQVYPNVNSWNSCCTVVEEMVRWFNAEMVPVGMAGPLGEEAA